ncbi:hypothetical protein Aperf_G00000055711 [Anoplocephala perfoliata]
MPRLTPVYLALYNGVQLLGWSYALVLTAIPQLKEVTYSAEQVLRIFQTLAILEVIHAYLRLVRSSPLTTAIQVGSRLLIVWGVLYLYPAVKVHESLVKLMFLSWCLADATRYLYYLINIFMEPPQLLTFLRYSLFLILYPTGILGEVLLTWYSLSYASKDPWLHYPLPNITNFGFDTFHLYCLILAMYIPDTC